MLVMVANIVDDDDYVKKVMIIAVDVSTDRTDHQNLINDHPMWMISLMKQVWSMMMQTVDVQDDVNDGEYDCLHDYYDDDDVGDKRMN